MFRKLLFLVILAGVGFGIYTGINKVVELMNTPKATSSSTIVSTILTGTTNTGTMNTGTTHTGSTTGEIKEPCVVKTGSDISGTALSKTIVVQTGSQTTGFFLGLWTSIKIWFTNLTTSTVTPIIVTTGSISTGAVISTGTTISGDALSGFFDEVSDTGSAIEPESTGTQTIIVTTVKKPTTTKTTPHKSTSSSDRDPVLDALF